LSAAEILQQPYFLGTQYFSESLASRCPLTPLLPSLPEEASSEVSAFVSRLHAAGLINLQKTTLPQYLFLKSLESELAVLNYRQPKDHGDFLDDYSGVGLYSNDDL
jgi:hypothetical protein